MKSLVIAANLLGVLLASAAGAADLALAPVLPAAGAGCPAYRFQGLYAGLNVGGLAWTANRTDQDAFISAAATQVQKQSGFVGGGQVGYSWSRCNSLFGVELDGDWTNASITMRFLPNTPGLDARLTSRFPGLITGRVRSGLVLDNLMIYLTGGFALASFRTTYSLATAAPLFAASTEISEWRWGWVTGLGTEWAWSERISITSEVLYVDVPDRERAQLIVPTAGGVPFFSNFTHGDSIWISKFGLNVKL
jgi:outer membrane immunogenic protein